MEYGQLEDNLYKKINHHDHIEIYNMSDKIPVFMQNKGI
jgi:hypothetical protein